MEAYDSSDAARAIAAAFTPQNDAIALLCLQALQNIGEGNLVAGTELRNLPIDTSSLDVQHAKGLALLKIPGAKSEGVELLRKVYEQKPFMCAIPSETFYDQEYSALVTAVRQRLKH